MAKKLKNENTMINNVYKFVLGLVTGLFVAALVFIIIDVVKPNDFSRLDNISVEELTKRTLDDKTGSFYVLVYNDGNEENEMIAEQVAAYNEYAKSTLNDTDPKNDAYPILKMEYSTNTKDILKSTLPSTVNFETFAEFPCLITITGNQISNTKTTVSTILETLESAKK
jgi:hypothetical protein